MCMTMQCWFSPLCFTKIDISFLNAMKKGYSKLFIFVWPNSWYTILKLIQYRKTFTTIYNIPFLVSIYFLTTKGPETIRRG